MKPPAKLNAGQYAKMVKKTTEAADKIAKMTARIRELETENEALKAHCAQQDASRRTTEAAHSEEFRAVMGEIQTVKQMLGRTP